MKTTLLSLALMLASTFLSGQTITKKSIDAVRISEKITIDGKFNEPGWQIASLAADFVQNAPDAGAASQKKTEVRVLYDDDALYVAATLYDDPSNIFNILSNRDQIGNSDFFGVVIDPYGAGLNGVGLVVTPAGVQFDTFYSSNGEDENWNAVWQSATDINDEGWTVEYKIPYAVLRFPSDNVQDWGINFTRTSRSINERAWWNEVNPNIQGFLNQAGTLKGLENIQAPPRLFFYPYTSAVLTNDAGQGVTETQFNGGMDLKYGINDAFTLDMTLIPDFSGVRSDNQVLNLSPFEVRFDENRQFFTEGTELFNKGGLFYSRRIGASFGNLVGDVGENERIISMPNDAPLINASKISGRTNKGLGLGFFNAVTNSSYAIAENIETGVRRDVEADPLSNFNVLVLDQNLKNNSSVTFINTSVLRSKQAPDANVSGLSFSLNDKNIKWNVSGFTAYSQILTKNEDGSVSNNTGHTYRINVGKVSGKFQYRVGRSVESDTYNPNDLGFLQNANSLGHWGNISFNQVKPFGILNRFRVNLNLNHNALYQPRRYSSWGFNLNGNGQFKNFWGFGFNFGMRPDHINDFFEPRTPGYWLERPSNANVNVWISSDGRKKLRGFMYSGMWRTTSWNQWDNWLGGELTYQVSDRFLLSHNLEILNQRKNRGFVTKTFDNNGGLDQIIIGQRDIEDVINTFNLSYIFTNRMGLTARVRHYWRTVYYYDYFDLNTEGQLSPSAYTGLDGENKIHDINFNIFNVDLVYNWQFAPGSELRFVWKRAGFLANGQTQIDFWRNFSNTVEVPSVDTFTIKVLYFLDYQNIKRVFGR